jgi:hypothetical protein
MQKHRINNPIGIAVGNRVIVRRVQSGKRSMTMTRTVPVLFVAALLAGGCHAPDKQASGDANVTAPPPGSAFAERIEALPEAQRAGVFMRAIADSGFACQKVDSATAHAPIDGRPAWVVGCDHGNDYIALASAGDMLQITPGRPADTRE